MPLAAAFGVCIAVGILGAALSGRLPTSTAAA